MKQWLMKFLSARLYSNLKAAADCSDAWQAAATPEYASKLAKQLLGK